MVSELLTGFQESTDSISPIPHRGQASPVSGRSGKRGAGAVLDDSGALDYLEGRPELDRKL